MRIFHYRCLSLGGYCLLVALLARPLWAAEPAVPSAALAEQPCGQRKRADTPAPDIDIDSIEKYPLAGASKTYVVKGFIVGACLKEAGYYEDGVLKKEITVPGKPAFKRYPFQVEVRPEQGPQIRAYNLFGDFASEPITIVAADGNFEAGTLGELKDLVR